MALKQRLDDEELALLEIIEDEVWLGEFLRSTTDGETDTNIWPKQAWEYRDYQRQFLTDKTEFILYTGGRAIGKCQPSGSRVYTSEGYRTIGELVKQKYFIAYTVDETKNLVQRRAVCIRDKMSSAYTLITASGHKFVSTENHPILTPEGYRLVADLDVGNYVAVATSLPFESTRHALQWHELRIMGYILLAWPFTVESKIKPRYKKIGAELEIISDRLLTIWHKDFEGRYSLHAKPGPFKHPVTSLFEQMKLYHAMRQYGAKKIPDMIMSECMENIQVFIEALFAQFATLSETNISITVPTPTFAENLQELLLRFSIESRISELGDKWLVELLDYRAIYRFFQKFQLPGIAVGKLPVPPESFDVTDSMRFEPIVNKYQSHEFTDTYAVHVYDYNNYIGDNVYVHNSVVLEDKILFNVINSHDQFPITPEMVFVTANQAQMSMPQSRFIMRFNSSPFLKDFLKGEVNKSIGLMAFPRGKGGPLKFWMRIAGSNGEQNMVGLHLPKIIGDECQIFPLGAYTQLMPAYNQWEPKTQQIWGGVPNGLRSSVLYLLDMQTPKYKKYRIPAPNNPFYTYEMYLDDLRRYGGDQDDRFQQLVLGRHGAAAFQVIPRETIRIELYPFYNHRYNSAQVLKGISYTDALTRESLPKNVKRVMFAIDPGFADPTIIQVLGLDDRNIWRTFIRYRLTRIDFNEQQNIIHWLDEFYKPDQIVIDIGAGGNGASIMHNMMYGEPYKNRGYEKKFKGVQFKENVLSGYNDDGEELFQEAKAYATTQLARIIQEGTLVFSEIDNEGISQMERVAKKKAINGRDTYFVLSDKGPSGKGGVGADEDDHIYASFICFLLGIHDNPIDPGVKKLGKARGSYT